VVPTEFLYLVTKHSS